MGGLFSCVGGHKLPNAFIDFDSVQPASEEERAHVSNFTETILTPSVQIVARLQAYQDAGAPIAAAISHASEENTLAAWNAVIPNVRFQEEIFDFSALLVNSFTTLLDFVLNVLKGNGIEVLDQYAAVTKCFADCFDIMLKIDEVVLGLPKLLGDLAFFRRTASRRGDSEQFESLLQKSSEITMFFGMSNPVLSKTISTLQSRYGGDDMKISQILGIFGSTVDICTATLINHNFENQNTKILALRCITGGTLMYDHISANGAFNNKTPFAVVEALRQLTSFQPKQNALINAIKYSSKHLGDPTTIPQVRELFA